MRFPFTHPRAERLAYVARSWSWIVSPQWWLSYAGRSTPAEIDRPIFILGLQGGGLTLLTRMLRRHGDVVSGAGGPDYWTSADEVQNIYGPLFPLALAGARWKYPDHPVMKGPFSWCYGTNDLFPLYRQDQSDATPELKTRFQRVLRAALQRNGRGVGAPRLIDKSQCYVVRVAMINELLAEHDPRFVLLTRDPYVSVHRAATGNAADMAALIGTLDLRERIDLCAEHYANCMRAALEDRDVAESGMLVVQFEHLLAEPERVLGQVASHCDLEMTSDMLPQAHHRLPYGSRFRDRWYPLRSEVNNRYADEIGRHTVRRVNELCGPMIEELGYRVRDESECLHEIGGGE